MNTTVDTNVTNGVNQRFPAIDVESDAPPHTDSAITSQAAATLSGKKKKRKQKKRKKN